MTPDWQQGFDCASLPPQSHILPGQSVVNASQAVMSASFQFPQLGLGRADPPVERQKVNHL